MQRKGRVYPADRADTFREWSSRTFRRPGPELPVIFVSGFTEDRFKDEFGENVSFLPKPFTLQQLAEKIKEVLDSVK